MNGPVTKQLRLLIVKDNPGDVRLIREALEQTGRHFQKTVAKDGAEALDYLFSRGTFVNAELPDLITLNLN